MAQVNAGRVRFISRGEYNNSTQYYLFDLVDYNGNSYFAKANTTGNVPTNTTYWQLVAEKGNTGNTGPTGPTGNGIDHISLTSQSGAIKTYTIYYTNGTTYDYNVTDGEVTQEVFDEEIDRLKMVYNALPSEEATGENITIDGTAEVPIRKIGLKGNTYQYSTSGKNMLNNSSLYLFSSNKYLATINYPTEGAIQVQPSTTYSLTFKGTNSALADKGIYSYDENQQNKERLTGTITTQDEHTVVSFTTLANTKYISFYVGGGNAYSTVNEYVEHFELMIIAGNTLVSYEPYTNGASPNPDYPQPVNVVSGDNTVKVINKNLLEMTATSQTRHGITFTVNDDKTILANGKATSTNHISLGQVYLEANTTYFISGCASGGASGKYRLNLRNSDDTIVKNDTGSGAEYTPTESGNYTLALEYFYNFTLTDLLFKPMIEVGNSATEYTPYVSQSYPVNLGVENLFDISTITAGKTINEGTGNATTDASNRDTSDFIKVKPNTQYTCSTTMTRYAYYDENKTFKNFYTSKTTITTNSDTQYIRFSYDNSLTNIQFEKGSKANSYSEYGTTPIELCKIGDYQDSIKKSTGKNLFDKSKATKGYIKQDGTITTSNVEWKISDYIKIIGGDNYTYQGLTDVGSSPYSAYYDENKTFISSFKQATGNNTIMIPNNAYYVRFSIRISNNDVSLNDINTFMISEGTSATSYEPYGKVWCLNKQIGKVVLDGSEGNWGSGSAYSKTVFYYNIADILVSTSSDDDALLICNNYKGYKINDFLTYDDYFLGRRTNQNQMLFRNKDISTLSDFKTWLGTNNTIVYYPLATPTTTEITDTTLIEQLDNLENAYSYDEQTNISQVNNDLPFIITAEAILSLKNILNI